MGVMVWLGLVWGKKEGGRRLLEKERERQRRLTCVVAAFFWHFYVKDGPYKDLQDSLFVSSARVFPGSSDGRFAASLEYRISKVDPGPLCQD